MKKISFLLTMLFLVIGGCGNDRMDQFEKGTIASCTAGGVSEEICSCAYEALEDHYSDEELLGMDDGIIPPDFFSYAQAATLKCVKDNS